MAVPPRLTLALDGEMLPPAPAEVLTPMLEPELLELLELLEPPEMPEPPDEPPQALTSMTAKPVRVASVLFIVVSSC